MKRRAIIIAALVANLFAGFAALNPSTALASNRYAGVSFMFLDNATISGSDGSYWVAKGSGGSSETSNHVFVNQNYSGPVGCPNNISGYDYKTDIIHIEDWSKPATTAVLIWRDPGPPPTATDTKINNCVDTKRTIQPSNGFQPVNTANFSILYDWTNSATITQVYGGRVFAQDSNNTNLYVEITDNKCKSSLTVVTPPHPFESDPPTTANFTLRGTDSHLGPKVGNCYEHDNGQVALGLTNNFSIATNSNGTTGTSTTASCDAGDFTWLLCPVIDIARNATDIIKGKIIDTLKFTPLTTNGGPAQAIWAQFRNLADVFFILIFFVIIFGTGLGLDNYTVKRVLPRLIAAAILVQFSFILLAVAVDISNVIGAGITQIISSVVTTSGGQNAGVFEPKGAIAGLAVVGTAGAVAAFINPAIIIPVILAFFAMIFGILTTFVTLEIRNLMIYALIIIAPIAIVLWVLPNTESIFKKWRSMFIGLLMMFPLIALIFGVADMFSIITSSSNDTDTMGRIIASIIPIVALFTVPWTFKFGGQLFNAGASAAGKVLNGTNKAVQNKGQAINKQRTEDRKQRALETLDKNGGRLGAIGRARARKQAGFGTFRNNPQREQQMNAARAKSRTDRAAIERQNLIANRNPAATEEQYAKSLESTANEALRTGDQAKLIATMQELGQTSEGRAKLAAINTEATGRGGSWRQAAEAGIAPNRAEIQKHAPDILNPEAFNQMTGDKFANLDAGSTERYIAHVKAAKERAATLAASGDTTSADYVAARSTMANAAGSIAQAATGKNSSSLQHMGLIQSSGIFDADARFNADPVARDNLANTKASVDSKFDADGNFIVTAPTT